MTEQSLSEIMHGMNEQAIARIEQAAVAAAMRQLVSDESLRLMQNVIEDDWELVPIAYIRAAVLAAVDRITEEDE